MSPAERFRFGGSAHTTSTAAELAERARRVEGLGFDTFVLPDHFEPGWFAAGPALTAVACATTTLRIGTTVYCNNFRHPALLAREIATIDVLSDGRMEPGLGAGYGLPEYAETGLALEAAGVRVDRLVEAVAVLKGLWADGPLTFAGDHYRITAMEGWPKPLQRPHPPLYLAGGGKRALTFAAREADIIGIIARARPEGGIDLGQDSEALLAQKVGWIREAAGARFDQLELSMLIWAVATTDHRRSAAADIAAGWGLTPDQVLASPYFLVGSTSSIVESLLALRERHGISYFTFFPRDVEPIAPVVAQLAGSSRSSNSS